MTKTLLICGSLPSINAKQHRILKLMLARLIQLKYFIISFDSGTLGKYLFSFALDAAREKNEHTNFFMQYGPPPPSKFYSPEQYNTVIMPFYRKQLLDGKKPDLCIFIGGTTESNLMYELCKKECIPYFGIPQFSGVGKLIYDKMGETLHTLDFTKEIVSTLAHSYNRLNNKTWKDPIEGPVSDIVLTINILTKIGCMHH